MLVAGVDEYGPSLYHTDPSGTFVRYEAKAIGAGSEGAQTQLQETYSKSMTLAEAETLALNTLKQVLPRNQQLFVLGLRFFHDNDALSIQKSIHLGPTYGSSTEFPTSVENLLMRVLQIDASTYSSTAHSVFATITLTALPCG